MTTTYYLEGMMKDGCYRTDSVVVKVVDIPDAILSGDTNLCKQPSSSNPVILEGAEWEGATYTWTPKTGIMGSSLSRTAKVRPSVTTAYRLEIKTPEGCMFEDSVTVYVHALAKEVDAGPNHVSCPGEKVLLEASGGVKYTWKPDPTLSTLDGASTIATATSSRYYYVTAANDFGCSSTDSVYITVKPFTPKLRQPFSSVCRGDTFKLVATGGTSYDWSPHTDMIDFTSGTPRVFPKKNTWYYVTITDSVVGCSYRDSLQIIIDSTCVWPGDANLDQKVDYLDILSLGVGFGNSGTPRTQIILWRAFLSKDWSKSTGEGVNYKHIDCNGTGFIDRFDTVPVYLHYGKVHGTPRIQQQVGTSMDPELRFFFEKDTFYAGDTVRAYLKLGSHSKQVRECYGIGWKYRYDTSWMVPNSSRFDFACDLFCDTASEFRIHRPGAGDGESALVRTTRKGFNGYGDMVMIEYILKDTLSANYNPAGEKISALVDFAQMIDSTGKILGVYPGGAEATVMRKRKTSEPPKPEPEPEPKRFRIYPNPADQTLVIEKGDMQMQEIVLCNSLGQHAFAADVSNVDRIEIPVSQLNSGIYFVLIQMPSGMLTRKVMIRH